MRFSKVIAIVLSLVIVLGGISLSYGETQGGTQVDTTPKHEYVPILMYHNFAKELQSNGRSGATITTDKFREDMTYLSENGYTALLPQDLKAIEEGKMKLPKKPVIITFDDGYESAYTIAYPILKETGMKATVFAIVGSIVDPGKKEIPKLKWEQMIEMYESGYMDIQSHSYNLHNDKVKGKYSTNQINGIQKRLVECKAQYVYRVEGDIVDSIETIEENVGNEVICFSYPYGVYEEWGKELLQKHGILFGFMTRYGMGDLNANLYQLNRFSVGMTTDLADLLEQ